jgi:LmbE family N-acetylglucosaminyl deacetylase
MRLCAALLVVLCTAGSLNAQSPEVQAGDTFSFREGGSRILGVALTVADGTSEMVWPEVRADDWDTAILGVDVTAHSDVPTPYVEISSGAASDRQYLRAGDAGARWLNLSFLRGRVAAGARVSFRGDGVSLARGPATLRLFSNALDLSRPMLVLAPHPDDAEIAAFGLYAHRKATVVTVTTGNAGPPSYGAVFAQWPELYAFKGRLRLIDSITVPWLGGIPPERTFNMGYFDARLAEMHENPGAVVSEMYSTNTDLGPYLKDNIGSLLPKRARASTWPNLVDDLLRVLKKVKPAVVVAPHPQLDSHRDHQFTAVALARALERWKQDVTLLLYTNHADQNRYPYGPAGTLASLPPPLPAEVRLDRLYSHPVTPDTQRLKLFALESMHDLRLSPSRIYQLVVGGDRTMSAEVEDPSGGLSYFRRGPRSNELFFVYDRRSWPSMIDAFLMAWKARPSP